MAPCDVLLVVPPSRAQVYQALSQSLAALEPPVWAGLIATYVRRRGYRVAILDAEAEGLTRQETAEAIAAADPILAVFVIYGQQPSASTQCMPGGREVCERLKAFGRIPTLVLGTHPSALPRRTLLEEPYTYVCQGEGPRTVLELLRVLTGGGGTLSEVPGLWYLDDGTPRANAPAPPIADLDGEVPEQAWDLLDMSRYRAHNWHCFQNLADRSGYASVQTSLGCPFTCTFCCINAPFGTPALRLWSAETIIKQIECLVTRYGVRHIKIPDEMFVLNRRHVLSLCDRLIERDYGLNIWAYARVDTVCDDVLERLKRAGFNWLGVGIESGSQHVRDGVEKGRFGEREIIASVRRIQAHGIHVAANYIFGLPDDTAASMQATLDLAVELNTEWANFYCAMAYPGSPLYALAKERRWPLPDDPGGPGWIGYSQHAYECLPLPTETLTAIDVLEFRDRAFTAYFRNPRYLGMLEGTFGPAVVEHVQAMCEHRIRRRHHDTSRLVSSLA